MTPGLPVLESEPLDHPTRDRRVAGVVLAAGTSSRFGDANKLLAEVDGAPIVAHATETLLDADLDPVVVVTGHEADAVAAAVDVHDVIVVENPDYATGQSSSVRVGVDALPDDVDAVVVALGDMPTVDPASVRRLVAAYEAGSGTALAAGVHGERGNPVLFDRQYFPALTALDGDVGARGVLLESADAAIVETGDPGVRRDVDHPDDLPE